MFNKFFPIVDMPQLLKYSRQSCAMAPKWGFFASCIFSEPCAAHFEHAFEIRTKVTPCVEVWYNVNTTSQACFLLYGATSSLYGMPMVTTTILMLR